MRKYPNVRYIETDLEDGISKKPRYHENMTSPKCDITNIDDRKSILDKHVELFDRTNLVADGLLMYFSLEQLAPLLKSITEYQRKESITVLYETSKIHRGLTYLLAKTFQIIVAWLTQSKLDFPYTHPQLTEDFSVVPGVKVISTKCKIRQK